MSERPDITYDKNGEVVSSERFQPGNLAGAFSPLAEPAMRLFSNDGLAASCENGQWKDNQGNALPGQPKVINNKDGEFTLIVEDPQNQSKPLFEKTYPPTKTGFLKKVGMLFK